MEVISQITPADDRWWLKVRALASLKRHAGYCKVDAQRLLDVISGLEAENARLRDELDKYRWRKKSDGNPKEYGFYEVLYRDNNMLRLTVTEYYGWEWALGYFDIVYWRPQVLPEE